MLQEDALKIKESSNGWLENWKVAYGIRETCITGEVSISTVKFRIERIPELVRRYKLEDISNMDKFGLFFELFPGKGLIEKAKN